DALEVFALVGAPAVIRLTGLAVSEHVPDPATEVLHKQPVAHVAPVTVDGQAVARERVEDHQRDQLLGVLPGPIAVRSAAHERLEPVGVEVAADEQVGARLWRAVWA